MKKRRLWLVGGVLIAIILVIAVVSISRLTTNPAMDAVNAFLTAIRDNRSSDAYNMLAWEMQRLANSSSFTGGKIGGTKIIDWDLFIASQNGDWITACGEIKSDDGWHVINLSLMYRDGKWQIWMPSVESHASQVRQTDPAARACIYF